MIKWISAETPPTEYSMTKEYFVLEWKNSNLESIILGWVSNTMSGWNLTFFWYRNGEYYVKKKFIYRYSKWQIKRMLW